MLEMKPDTDSVFICNKYLAVIQKGQRYSEMKPYTDSLLICNKFGSSSKDTMLLEIMPDTDSVHMQYMFGSKAEVTTTLGNEA